MNVKKIVSISFVLFCLLASSTEMDAQRRGTKKRESKETTEDSSRSRSSRDRDSETESISLRDRLIYDIHLGQLGFNSGFQISVKGGAAYKFNDVLSLGLGLKTFYYAQNFQGTQFDGSFFDYGVYLYPRVKLSEQFYLKGEYYYISKDNEFDNRGNLERSNKAFPLVGAGYLSGYGPWKFGLELLYIVADNQDKDNFFYGDYFEYMFSFVYNF